MRSLVLTLDQLAIAMYAYAALTAIGSCLVVAIDVGAIAMILGMVGLGELEVAVSLISGAVGLVLATALLIGFIALYATAGLGLRARRPWARPLGLVASVFALGSVPFGTLLGLVGLLTLLDPERAAELAAGAEPA